MDDHDRDEKMIHLQAVADMLGISMEALLATQMTAINRIEEEAEEVDSLPPPPIVYPNVKFKKYVFREYPKLAYRGYIQDIERAETRITRNDDGTTTEKTIIRVIPDQFVVETRELKNRVEELAMGSENKRFPLGKVWVLTHQEARDNAMEAKKNARPIVEREATAAERKAAREAADREAEEAATIRAASTRDKIEHSRKRGKAA